MSETPPEGASEEGDSLLREVLGMGRKIPPAVLVPGQLVAGTYRIVRPLGAGGMGVVYLARDQRLGRDVAIKLHAAAPSARSVERLAREASAIAQLTHDNIVTVYQIDSIDGQPFVAMEYVDGGTARTWLAAAPRTWREIVALYVAAGRGLAAAHRLGLVHRDFKPDNVLVGGDGRVRVADFGLVQGAVPTAAGDLLVTADGDDDGERDGDHGAAPSTLTGTGVVLGTPAYMAPEQHAGAAVGAAADQFAFAVSLWEALAGARPFRGDTAETLRAAIDRPLAPPATPMPRHVEAALRRALATAPAERWPAMEPLLAALTRDPARTRRRVAGGIAIGAVVLAAAAALIWRAGAAGEAPPDPCAPAATALAGAQAQRAALAMPAGDPVMAKLDAWMASWRTARITACEDTHVRRTRSLAQLELRDRCLDRARAGLEATLAAMPAAKDASQLVDGLPLLAECADLVGLATTAPMPQDPAARAEIEAVSAALAEVEVLHTAGRFPEAAAALDALMPRAEATKRKTLIAEALIAKGAVLGSTGKLDGVVELFERAAKLAAEDGDDRIAARAWLSDLDAFVARLERPTEAARLLAVAEAAVLRAGNTDRQRSELLGLTGEVAMTRADWPAARTSYEEAIALHERVFGQDAELARKLNRLAGISMRLDDMDAARRHAARAAELLERNYGPRYRHLPVIWTTLGGVEYLSGNPKAARASFERVLAFREEVDGPASVRLVQPLTDLATALNDLDELDLAGRHLQRALDIGRKELGPEHPKVVGAMRSLARNQLARNDAAAAEATLTEAIAIQRRNANLPPLDDMELDLARLLVGVERYGEARAAVARAKQVPRPDAETSIAAIKSLEVTGTIELAAGNRAAGRAALQRAVAILRDKYGPDHDDVVRLQKIIDAE